ncbi:hypothetical protein CONPUDRAFT_133923 [Coniophora puteana RWD-64-598 SS2]|uniref:Uncharacterized protein n=1 Tax=Coniophora puteana (strain RWD-64-598) TaxID=741705 RepID=A0A5M3N535_CONPW|nr:uncharacterized protein CONPUDRAFT_133923 [Coniophora puteana RWD-64-598 SS2]EIW86503.1 hypothetical protein CONPUDRAFT_133923 [Coniophora puteana RWD-64-598 SS2]
MTETTVVIVVVVCAVAVIAIAVVAYRTIRNRFIRNSRPLPPVQPIVSTRARNLADFEANAAYLRAQPDISVDVIPGTPNSSVPLVLNQSVSSVSLYAMEKASFPSSRYGSGISTPLSSEPRLAHYDADPSAPLQPPPRHSRRPDTASSSHSYTSDAPSGTLSPFSSETPSSATSFNTCSPSSSRLYSPSPSSSSLSAAGANAALATGAGAEAKHVRSASRPRSIASATTEHTSYTTRTASSARLGLPHNPHSGVRVVLPAPLGSDPSLHTYAAVGPGSGERRARPRPQNAYALSVVSHSASRVSVADVWAPAVYRAAAAIDDDKAHLRNSCAPLAQSRLPNAAPTSLSAEGRRRSSTSSVTAPPDLVPPPVPRVPGAYGIGKAPVEQQRLPSHLRQRSKSGPGPGELSMSVSVASS